MASRVSFPLLRCAARSFFLSACVMLASCEHSTTT
jgi:hypothetical protein